jgi:hypothetical protein
MIQPKTEIPSYRFDLFFMACGDSLSPITTGRVKRLAGERRIKYSSTHASFASLLNQRAILVVQGRPYERRFQVE